MHCSRAKWPALCIVFLLLLAGILNQFVPACRERLCAVLFGPEDGPVASACQAFYRAVEHGDSLRDALEAIYEQSELTPR